MESLISAVPQGRGGALAGQDTYVDAGASISKTRNLILVVTLSSFLTNSLLMWGECTDQY